MVFVTLCFGVGSSARAATFSFVDPDRAASVTFEVGDNANQLKVILTNTFTGDALAPSDILTAVFYRSSSIATLTPFSARVNAGSAVHFETVAPFPSDEGDIGGEWAYRGDLTGPFNHGISSTGLSLFSAADVFPPAIDLDSPASPNGVNYGITSAGDDLTTGNLKVTGKEPLVKNSVVFRLTSSAVVDDNFLNAISQVRFQYGTSLSEPHRDVPPPDQGPLIPEPASLAIWLIGASSFGLVLRRRAITRR